MWVLGSLSYGVAVLIGFYRWLEPDREPSQPQSQPQPLLTT
jgi:hypothetical protein